MFELSVDTHFSAAHCLDGYQGDCARMHGHTWKVTAAIKGTGQDEVGMVVDFKVLSAALDDIIEPFDHRTLNDIEDFREINPTAENIARFIYGKLAQALRAYPVTISSVTVAESDRYRVTYREE